MLIHSLQSNREPAKELYFLKSRSNEELLGSLLFNIISKELGKRNQMPTLQIPESLKTNVRVCAFDNIF